MTTEMLTTTRSNPFPGLRPFEFDESHLFFGRDGQSEQVLRKLSATRFVAIVGTSGSGKSSLARAGLLPELYGAMMPSAGSNWRVAIVRPGNDPIGELARKLNAPDVFGSEHPDNAKLQATITEATLRRGSLGLIEAVQQAMMPASENLLVLVDQFEELFRFAKPDKFASTAKNDVVKNEAAAFVKLLLEASRQHEVNIYIVLTMRSGSLGECAMFRDLPEAINEGQYLVPRLTRDQLRAAITGPLAVAGATITPRLLDRLLNDVGDDQDQLPVLQHALMRMWDEWKDQELLIDGNPHRDAHQGEAIDLCCYEAVGGMAEALSRHADKAYNELPDDRHRLIAENLFKCLTEKDDENLETRRPIMLKEICAVANAIEPEVIAVINAFRQEGRSFLMPPEKTRLHVESLIDISHESLIRVWHTLSNWVDEEANSARTYQRLAVSAVAHQDDEEDLLQSTRLRLDQEWLERTHPNEAWAKRYHPEFNLAMSFLEKSKSTREKEMLQNERNRKWLKRGSIIILTFTTLLALYAFYQRYRAEQGEEAYRKMLYVSDIKLASVSFENKSFRTGYELLYRYLPDPNKAKLNDLREFSWRCLWWMYHNEARTFTGHTNWLRSVCFSPDGKTLASGSSDRTIKLWEVQSGKELATLNGHTDMVLSVAFSPDGKTLASGSRDRTIKLWEVQSGKELTSLRWQVNTINSIAFSADGTILATGSADKTIKLYYAPVYE